MGLGIFSETKISMTMRNFKIEKSASYTLILEFWPQSIYIVRFSRFQHWPTLLYSIEYSTVQYSTVYSTVQCRTTYLTTYCKSPQPIFFALLKFLFSKFSLNPPPPPVEECWYRNPGQDWTNLIHALTVRLYRIPKIRLKTDALERA